MSNTPKPLLLLDLDGTLFDAALLKQRIDSDLQKLGIKTDQLWKLEKQERGKGLHISRSISEFAKSTQQENQIEKIQELFLHQPFTECVYSEVLETLKELKQKFQLAAFTQGDVSYQQVKIAESGLHPFFDFLYIFDSKLPQLEGVCALFPDQEIWYVDNQVELLKEAARLVPSIKTVWIDRDNHQTQQANFDFTPTARITLFDELLQAIS